MEAVVMAAPTTHRLWNQIAALSPDKQQSVVDFVEFLQRQPAPPLNPAQPPWAIAPPQSFTSNDFDDW
jgi:hypothetical protein